jgi:hypothetical protein
MAKAHTTWTVLKHGPIEKLDDNLWTIEGTLPRDPPMKRVMVLVRLGDGRLIVHNAVSLGDAEMKEIEAWGRPAFLIVPGGRHRLDAPAWKARFPSLTVVAPPGARAQVAEVVAVDRTSGDFGDPSVSWRPLGGTRERECVLEVRSPSGTTVVLNDAVMNFRHGRGFAGLVLRLLGFSGPAPKVTPLTIKLLVDDRAALRADLEKLAATPELRRVVVSHGIPLDGEGLRGAAAAL